MTQNLMLTEAILLTVTFLGFIVMREFIKSRNGMLRKIMIAYFGVEIWIYGLSAIYFWLYDTGRIHISMDIFRLIILFPKVAIKIILFAYLRGKL